LLVWIFPFVRLGSSDCQCCKLSPKEAATYQDALLALETRQKLEESLDFKNQSENSVVDVVPSKPKSHPKLNLPNQKFNPNQLTTKDWLSFGLPQKVVDNIEKYKSKGGKLKGPSSGS